MNKAYILGGLAGAYMLMRFFDKAQNAVKTMETVISVSMVKFPSPLTMVLPVKVKILNYQNVNLPVDSIKVTVDRKNGDNWEQIAHNMPGSKFVVKARSATEINVDMSFSIMSLAKELLEVLSVGKKQIRIGVVSTAFGVVLPPTYYFY